MEFFSRGTKYLTRASSAVIVEQLFLVLVGIVNIAIVSRVGKSELVASTMTNQFIVWLQFFFIGIASGSTVVIGNMWGERDLGGVKNAVAQTMVMVGLISIALFFLVFAFSNQALYWIFGNVEQDVAENIKIYLHYNMLSMPFVAIFSVAGAACRGVGDNKSPLYTTIVINVVNVVFSYLFIYGYAPLHVPSMGMAGAGIGVGAARAAGALFIIIYVIASRHIILPKLTHFTKIDIPILKKIVAIGIPASFEQIIFQGGFVLQQRIFVSFGTAFQGGFQVAASANGLLYAPANAIGIAATAMIAQAIGSHNIKKVMRIKKASMHIAIVFFAILGVLMLLCAEPVASLYTKNSEVLAVSVFFLRMFALQAPMISYICIFSGILRGAGDVKYVAFISVVSLWMTRFILVWLIYRFSANPYLAVTIGVTADFVIRTVLYHLRVEKGEWLNRRL